jgi:hypothetical protein
MSGFPGPSGSIGSVGHTYITELGRKRYVSFTNPLIPTGVRISVGSLWLTHPSSYYVIPVSIEHLGDAYTPSGLPSVPGSWYIKTIYAAPKPVHTDFPTEVFDMSQLPVTLFFQNVGGVPIQIHFGNDDSRTNVTYFSFGVSPNITPSSYLLPPLGILVIEAIFTNLNVIRFYNSFLDSLNPNKFFRIADQASKVGYFSPQVKAPPLLNYTNRFVLDTDTTLSIGTLVNSYSQNLVETTAELTLTIDGTGAPPLGETLILIRPQAPVQLRLVNLVNSRNYKGETIPSTLEPVDLFLVVTGTRAVAYDSGGSSSLNSLTYSQNTVVLIFDVNYSNPGTYSTPATQLSKYVTQFAYQAGDTVSFTLVAGSYEISGVLTGYPSNGDTFTYQLSPSDVVSSSEHATVSFQVTGTEGALFPLWNITVTQDTQIVISSTGATDSNGKYYVSAVPAS